MGFILSLAAALAATSDLIGELIPAPSTPTQPTITGMETRIADFPGNQFDPHISANLISYTDERAQDSRIAYYDLSHQQAGFIGATTAARASDTAEGMIAYEDRASNRILVYDIHTGGAIAALIPHTASSDAMAPAIDHGLVAWQESRNGAADIWARDLATGEERHISAPTGDSNEQPIVNQGIIVWQSCSDDGNTKRGSCDIWSYDWGTRIARKLTDEPPGVRARQANISGTWVVYDVEHVQAGTNTAGDQHICALNLNTPGATCLALPGAQMHGRVSGDDIVFEDQSDGRSHLKLWHIPSDAVVDFPLNAGSNQYLGEIDGNRVVYADDRDGHLAIYLFQFALILPHARDMTAPTIDITSPASGAVYVYGQPAAPQYTCHDPDGEADVMICRGQGITDEGGLLTDTAGLHVFYVIASDYGGNAVSAWVSYGVRYDWGSGLLAPINPGGPTTISRGRTVSIRFKLAGASSGITDAVIWAYLVPIGSDGSEGPPLAAHAASGDRQDNAFHYDAGIGQYTFNLSMANYSAGRYALRLYIGHDPKIGVLQGEAILDLQ